MSAVAFYFTDILVGVKDDDFLSRCQIVSKRSSLATGIDVEVILWCFHATDDVLPQKIPMCLNVKSSTIYSITIHPITNPYNSRFFIVNLPFVFV